MSRKIKEPKNNEVNNSNILVMPIIYWNEETTAINIAKKK